MDISCSTQISVFLFFGVLSCRHSNHTLCLAPYLNLKALLSTRSGVWSNRVSLWSLNHIHIHQMVLDGCNPFRHKTGLASNWASSTGTMVLTNLSLYYHPWMGLWGSLGKVEYTTAISNHLSYLYSYLKESLGCKKHSSLWIVKDIGLCDPHLLVEPLTCS